MYRLIESIKVFDKKFYNLEYHQARVDFSRRNYLGLTDELNLARNLHIPNELTNTLFKCRVLYSDIIHTIEFIPYIKKKVKNIRIVHSDRVEYTYKYENRLILNELLEKSKADDIIIIKNGFVTDAFSSNTVFFDGKDYYTSSSPLLKGTNRTKLLDEKIIFEAEIREKDIKKFESVILINAMNDLFVAETIPISKIKFD